MAAVIALATWQALPPITYLLLLAINPLRSFELFILQAYKSAIAHSPSLAIGAS
jgi:hypothetical protein